MQEDTNLPTQMGEEPFILHTRQMATAGTRVDRNPKLPIQKSQSFKGFWTREWSDPPEQGPQPPTLSQLAHNLECAQLILRLPLTVVLDARFHEETLRPSLSNQSSCM